MPSPIRLTALLALAAAAAFAQDFVSPEVSADRRVTFRVHAPKAGAVSVVGLAGLAPQPLSKDEHGVWSATVGPLAPDLYEYAFDVDGARFTDPRNRELKEWIVSVNQLLVPGGAPALFEVRDVPHGTVTQHTYSSSVTGTQRQLLVYAPPGFDPRSGERYPVLYLLHGYGDDETAWTEVGRAHRIAENLLAEGALRRFLIVMTHGHPSPRPTGREGDYFERNNTAMEREILEVVVPLIDRTYPTLPAREGRAVMGLSMGGGHSLVLGLRHPETFAYVGAFSSAIPGEEDPDAYFAGLLKPGAPRPALLWISCGKDDFLIERNQRFIAWLTSRGIQHSWELTAGGHEWGNWRAYLARSLPLLFRDGR